MALSQREKEILELLSLGYAYREISEELQISPRTISTYVERIIYKMRARNRVSAVASYIKERYQSA